MSDWPKHAIPENVRAIIARCHWQSVKDPDDIAPHQYVVKGWNKDDVTEDEFWTVVNAIKELGRREVWTPPEEWVRRWGGKPQRNTYLYVKTDDGEHAYWVTRTGVWMLNRELVSQQAITPTRRAIDKPATQLRLEDVR